MLYRLKEAGYQAFLVGGCVRDMLIGRQPKDFDVATNALPDEVRRLFRNCRLVGRRFRLAHVVFGREVIEVATFRAATAPSPREEPVPEADPEEGEAPELVEDAEGDAQIEELDPERVGIDHERVLDTHGRLLRDNVYGSIEEDVWRRDFTANALYYNIADFSIWDFVGGVEDIAARRLRLIGDPETRYREDPVRMLRAARFEAKLGFALEPATAEPIGGCGACCSGCRRRACSMRRRSYFSPAMASAASRCCVVARCSLRCFPPSGRYLATQPAGVVEQLLQQGLRNTDERVAADKPVTADLPVRAPALWPDRREHRDAATAALARDRRHCRGLRARAARGFRSRHHPAARRPRGTRDVWRCSRGSSSRGASGRCACSSSRVSAPPSIC